jgi:radical SAM superfamily enzyme YgiQ (UPF0313 family)
VEACARIALDLRFEGLKLYAMVGLPGEEDGDVDELVGLCRRLAAVHPLDLGVSPFVPKRGTPLEGAPWAGIRTVERRLARLAQGLGGAARVRPASARAAWVEWRLARGGPEAGLAAWRAVGEGGGFAAFRRALEEDPALSSSR